MCELVCKSVYKSNYLCLCNREFCQVGSRFLCVSAYEEINSICMCAFVFMSKCLKVCMEKKGVGISMNLDYVYVHLFRLYGCRKSKLYKILFI